MILFCRPTSRRQSCRLPAHSGTQGLTLVELAVSLFILTLLSAGLIGIAAAQVQIRRQAEVRLQLELARDAVLAFAAAQGRLPCPASASSRGRESFCLQASGSCDGTATAEMQSHGNCSNFHDGFLPAATLGLAPLDEEGYQRDSWGTPGGRIRYAVHDVAINSVQHVLTGTDRMRQATMSEIVGVSSPTTLLIVCARVSSRSVTQNCGTGTSAIPLASNVPFIIFSTGANGVANAGGSSDLEAENLDGDRVFVSGAGISGGAEFDDQVVWSSLLLVFDRMMRGGRLP